MLLNVIGAEVLTVNPIASTNPTVTIAAMVVASSGLILMIPLCCILPTKLMYQMVPYLRFDLHQAFLLI
jgi:hypothetical protein